MSLVGYKSSNHVQQVAVRGPLDEVDDRGTPQDLFNALSERFGGFTLDVAAAPHNAKCERYYTRADDGLSLPWRGRVWCNPPYSKLQPWLAKAWLEHVETELIVMLLPANRTEQGWWQSYVEQQRDRPNSPLSVEFLPGRLRFVRPGETAVKPNDRPPFGCCLLIWTNKAAQS